MGWVRLSRLDAGEGADGIHAGVEPARLHPPPAPPLQGGGSMERST